MFGKLREGTSIQTLRIEKLVFRGDGLGRIEEGQVVFVPYTAPGDRIRVEVKEAKADYLRGTLVEVVEPSPVRAIPPCPYFGTCGGCQWLHLEYRAQLEWKQKILEELILRIGRLSGIEFSPPLGCLSPLHYRIRAQLKAELRRGRLALGFYRSGSARVVDIERCPLLHPLLDQAFHFLRGLRHPSLQQLFPKLQEIWLMAGARTGELLIALWAFQGTRQALRYLYHVAKEHLPNLVGMVLFRRDPRTAKPVDWEGQPFYTERVQDLKFRVSAGAFFQVGEAAAEDLVQAVLDFAELKGEERVLDLYCGVGTFALPLARRAAEVVGVEAGEAASRDAVYNGELNGVGNCRIVPALVEKALLKLSNERWDLVVLDPPREGLSRGAFEGLLNLAPSRIIYVSCDPATLARDVALLTGYGYRFIKVQLLDLFPQTYHIEAVALLARS